MIYNASASRFSFYNGSAWVILISDIAVYLSIDAKSPLIPSSTSDVVVSDMTQTTPETTTYLVLFNGQATLPAANSAEGINTATLASDLNLIYTDIMAIPASSSMHPLVFGSGETLSTGIYDIAGPTTIALQEEYSDELHT